MGEAEDDDGFTFNELVPPPPSKDVCGSIAGASKRRAALQAVNEEEERNRRPIMIPQSLASSSVIIKKNRGDGGAGGGGLEDFEIKTVLCRTPRSKSTIAGFAPKSTSQQQQQQQPPATDAVTAKDDDGENGNGDNDAETDLALDNKIKEELKDLEEHFFGSGVETVTSTGRGAKHSSEKLKQRPPLKKSSTRDDPVFSAMAENGRQERSRRRLSTTTTRTRDRPDFAHTIDFSSLRTVSHASATAATTSTSAVGVSRDSCKQTAPASDASVTAKPTRKGLRKGSLSRSLKVFQDREGEGEGHSASSGATDECINHLVARLSLRIESFSHPNTQQPRNAAKEEQDEPRGQGLAFLGDYSIQFVGQPRLLERALSSASLMTSRRRDRIKDDDRSSLSKESLPPLPAESVKLTKPSETDEARKKAGSGSVRLKAFALSLSSLSAVNFTNPLSARSAQTEEPLSARAGPSHDDYDANSGLLWRVYERPEEHARELVAGRMAAIVSHIIEVACINEDGTLKDQDRLHRFLLSYTQWLSPDDMFSLLLAHYGLSEESLNPKTKRYVSSLASASSFTTTGSLDADDEENFVLRRKIRAFLQEWIKVKHLTDFSTPLSKKVIILLNRAIREEKEEEKALERSVDLSSQNSSDSNDWHQSSKQEEASASETSPQLRRHKKGVLGRMDQFQASMPSPYSPTSFSKKLSMKAGQNKLNARQFTKVSILTLRSAKVAKQLSRIDFGLFQKVVPTEFDKLAFSKDCREIMSPNIKAMADRFNQVSYWVATEILKSPSARARQKTLQKFIAVASKLKKNGNFASFFAVGAGLNIHSVSRLKALWEDLPQKYQQAFDDMMALLNNKRNYHNYRSLFLRRMKAMTATGSSEQVAPSGSMADSTEADSPAQDSYPLIPYIGVFTRDFTFLDEGNMNMVPVPSSPASPSSSSSASTAEHEGTAGAAEGLGDDWALPTAPEEKLVNYEKMELWGGLLLMLKKLQGQRCTIESDLAIDNYLANFSPLTDNNLYRTSSSILRGLD